MKYRPFPLFENGRFVSRYRPRPANAQEIAPRPHIGVLCDHPGGTWTLFAILAGSECRHPEVDVQRLAMKGIG
jgi:hypothetical protein